MSRPPSGATTPIRRSSPIRAPVSAAPPRQPSPTTRTRLATATSTTRQPSPTPRARVVSTAAAAPPRQPSPTTRARVATNAPVVGAGSRRSSSAQNAPITPRRAAVPDAPLRSSQQRNTTPVGMVATPRVVTRRSASETGGGGGGSTYRRITSDSPVRRMSNPPTPTAVARNRPLSASQKAVTENEHKEMMKRVNKIMAVERPLNSQNLYRISGSDEDLRLMHQDRSQRDPFIKGAVIDCSRSRSSNQSKQVGALISQSPTTSRPSTPSRVQSPGRISERSTLKTGFVPTKVEPFTKRKTYAPSSPSPVRSASPVAPWTKPSDIRASSRNHAENLTIRNSTPERSRPLDFNPSAPIDAHRTKITPKDKHHLVFRDEPSSVRARSAGSRPRTVIDDAPEAKLTGVKNQAVIAQEVACQAPPQLPPPRKPSIKRNVEAQYAHDIFGHVTQTSVLQNSPRPTGVHFAPRASSTGRSNPNDLVSQAGRTEEDKKVAHRPISHRNTLSAVPLGYIATADPAPENRNTFTNVKVSGYKLTDTTRVITPKPGGDPVQDRKIRALQSSPLKGRKGISDNVGSVLGHQPSSRAQSPVSGSQLRSKLQQQSPMSQRKPSLVANRSSAVQNCLSWD